MKASGWLKDVFMQAVPAEADWPPKLWVCDYRMKAIQGKTQAQKDRKE